MKRSNSILMLSTADWDEPNWTNKQHIATAFYKKGFKIVYVEPPIFIGRFVINWIKHFKNQPWYKKLLLFRRYKRDFYIIPQFYFFPARFEKTNYYFGSFLNTIFIKFILFILNVDSPYIINYLPYGGEYVGKFNERSFVYDCVDEYSGMKRIMKDIKFVEKKLMRRASGITVTARGLLNRKKRFNRNIRLAHNVGNTHLFLREKLNFNMPRALKPFQGRKIAGFIGAVNFKIDTVLLKKILEKFKDVQFIFIGPIYEFPKKEFEQYENIIFLGAKKLDDLPAYMQYFDFGIIPYYVNEYTNFVFPLKLFEFFAAKIPVISTALPEILYYKNIAFVGEDHNEFLKLIEQVIKEQYNNKRLEEGYELASQYNWDKRSEIIWKVLKQGEE